jgi:hypothetical protein
LNEARLLQDNGGFMFKAFLIGDSMSVYAAITAQQIKQPAEKTMLTHLLRISELLDRGILRGLVWADTRSMHADGLTKGSVDRHMIHSVMNSVWPIEHETKVGISPLQLRSV